MTVQLTLVLSYSRNCFWKNHWISLLQISTRRLVKPSLLQQGHEPYGHELITRSWAHSAWVCQVEDQTGTEERTTFRMIYLYQGTSFHRKFKGTRYFPCFPAFFYWLILKSLLLIQLILMFSNSAMELIMWEMCWNSFIQSEY